jgi:hypothetical protein
MVMLRRVSLFALALLLLLLCSPTVLAQPRPPGPPGGPDPGTVVGGIVAVWAVAFLCILVMMVLSFCLQIYICYFMYTDANARGENGTLWAVIGFFGGLVGLIIWLCVRPEKSKGRRRR